VTAEGAGFDHDTNVITIYSRDGSEKAFARMPKIDAAHRILDHIRASRQPTGRTIGTNGRDATLALTRQWIPP